MGLVAAGGAQGGDQAVLLERLHHVAVAGVGGKIAGAFAELLDLRRGVREVEVLGAELAPLGEDQRALEQVLTNLVDNGIKYCPPGSRVVVKARPEGEHLLRFSVEDSGPGIPERDLPRIFERFYRVDPGRSREMGGTGLGLSIVKHLVEAMGGEVGVESRVGVGSSFWFTLPRA